jgi:hypothetical protein
MTPPVTDKPDTPNVVVSINTIPCEIHLDILYHLLLPFAQRLFDTNRRIIALGRKTVIHDWIMNIGSTIAEGVRAYCLASPMAYACWKGNRRVLLQRVANTLLQQTHHHVEAARREGVRRRMRMAIWKAVSVVGASKFAEDRFRVEQMNDKDLKFQHEWEGVRENVIRILPWCKDRPLFNL